MDHAPEPLVPPDVDLRGLEYMPLFGHHLLGSDFHSRCSDAEWRAGVTLWWKAWNQVPAASLPDDDEALCRLADLGRDVKGWKKLRAKALHGFVLCSDGRLYHRFLAPQALIAWEKRQLDREEKSGEAERKKKERERRSRMFEQLAALGVTPAWNTSTSELRALVTQHAPPVTVTSHAGNAPNVTAPVTPVTGEVTAKTGRDVTGRDVTGRDDIPPNPGGAFHPPPDPPAVAAAKKPATSPRQTAERQEGKSTAVWQSFAASYRQRYGTDPVRNAKVNGQLVAVVDRLGAEEAPQVAAFYVGHNRRIYVEAKHPADLLLRDCEGLRTEWATGRHVTSTQAMQADRTQTNANAFAPLIEEARARKLANEA